MKIRGAKRILQNLLLLSVSLMFAVALIEAGVRLTKVELYPPKLFISQTEGVPYKLRPDFTATPQLESRWTSIRWA